MGKEIDLPLDTYIGMATMIKLFQITWKYHYPTND